MSGVVERLHATVIAVGKRCALIRGPSGAGKSDIALRCLALGPSGLLANGAQLVADDQVIIERRASRLVATAPAQLRGKLEVRGVGILEVAAAEEADVVLVADLVRAGPIERLPGPWPTIHIMGLEVPLIQLLPFEDSAHLKLLAALVMAALPRVESKA